MSEFLKKILGGGNEFASGGLLLMLIGGVTVYLKAIPSRLWHWFVDQTTMTITVTDDDAAFRWVKEWFLEQKVLRRTPRVQLDTTLRNARGAITTSTGQHWR